MAEYPDDISTYEKWVLAGEKAAENRSDESKGDTPYLPDVMTNTRDDQSKSGLLMVGYYFWRSDLDVSQPSSTVLRGKAQRQSNAEQRQRPAVRQALQKTEKQLSLQAN